MSIARPVAATVAALALFAGVARAACPSVDHAYAQWSAILARWVSGGLVDYVGIKRESEAPLGQYLAMLSGACKADYDSWSRDQRIAFWINAYNAFTVRLILDHYPVASIRRIGWLPLAAFRDRFIPMPELKGATISLNEIENEILRAQFREPRIHFALVCASRSCPPLRGEAYRGTDLDRQLNDQARTFLSDVTKNRIDTKNQTLYLSSIFDWFRGDFEAAAGSVPAYIAQYIEGHGTRLSAYRIEYLDYDWALNERKTEPPR